MILENGKNQTRQLSLAKETLLLIIIGLETFKSRFRDYIQPWLSLDVNI